MLFLGFGLLFSYLAWSTYKLRISAWWVTLDACLLFGLSTLVSFTRFSPLDLYREMGYPADQLKMMKDMGVLDLNIPLLTGGYMVVFIAYLIWVRRHWVQPA